MSDLQTTLGGGDGIAEELAANQRSISIAEFFEKNKHMLGFDSNARAIITAIKEGVDNALDATEEAGILPDIYVEIRETGDYYTLVIEDNGPGIPKANIPKVFGKLLYGSRFGSMTQSRGQQGIGISAAVLYSQLTSGQPARITSRPKGSDAAQYVELILDTDTNEPEIQTEREVDWDRPHGTRIELEMEANMRARSRLYDYIRATAVVNPHARLTFIEPDQREPLVFERATDDLPHKPEEIRPHPHGVELGHVIKMLQKTDSHSLSGFLQEEFTRVGAKSATDILDTFRDTWYGREMAWDASLYDSVVREYTNETGAEMALELSDLVHEAVSNKAATEVDAFASEIETQLLAADRVSYGAIQQIVADAATTVETEFSTRFGPTVRENTVETIWDGLTIVRDADMEALFSATASKRKNTEAVALLAQVVVRRLSEAEYDRATYSDIETFIDAGATQASKRHGETFGETSKEKLIEALWSAMQTVDEDVPLVREVKDDRDMASALLTGMQRASVSRPSTKCLSPITPEKVKAGLEKEYEAEYYSSTTRDAGVHSGHPFIVEAGIAYGGDIEAEGKIDLLRFANRVPLVYQPGACAITQTIGSIGWRNYQLSQPGGSGLPDGPVVLMVHVASTNVPFTSESKDALASVPSIEYEIEQAVRECARDLKKYLKKRQSLQKQKRKQNVIAEILPSMATKLANVTGETEPEIEGALARIMNHVFVRATADGEQVTLDISNHSSSAASFKVATVLSDEPTNVSDGLSLVSMDDEWIISWEDTIGAGESLSLSYETPEGRTDLTLSDIEDENVTIVN